MLERTILTQIENSVHHFPVTILSGPRQVGKSTLLHRKMIEKGYSYVTLDNRIDRMDAINDPQSFLQRLTYPVIIDEFQRAKELFIEIEEYVNKVRLEKSTKEANGLFILSGSSSKALLENAKETMAGRCTILKMSPLSLREIYQKEEIPFNIDKVISRKRSLDYSINETKLLDYVVKGCMPQLYDDPDLPLEQFFSSYIETYITRDLPEVLEIRNDKQFNDFLTLLASNTGEELIYDNYAKSVGVKSPTIKQWISALEKTGIIWLAKPYNENSITKTIIKRPKMYFFDSGFACFLAGIRDSKALSNSFLKGRFVETFIANEIRKSYQNFALDQPIFYYRDTNQNEIDLVIVREGRLMLIECKTSTNFNKSDVVAFKCLDNTYYNKSTNAIICSTTEPYSITENVIALPISAI